MKKAILILASIILCGSTIFAQSNHWSLDNPGAYASHLNTWIAVELDGVRLASTDIELAAFVDGECRGVERLAVYDEEWGYLASIQIFKDNAGDVITFKMYDHATSTEYDDCSTTVTTQVAGEEMGATPMNPTVAVFTSPTSEEPTGPEHPWVPASFSSNMSIFAEIQIDGVPQSGDNWEVGAFCGDECRGDQIGTVEAPTEFGQMLSMVVYGVNGDVINFYLYDIKNQSIVGVCSTTVTYVEQGNAGVVWDPIILNFITTPMFTKDILAYTANSKDRYYLIASPIGEVNPENVEHMLENEYDLYYFNQSADLEWINYESGGYNLTPGKGYLYANSNDVTLAFYGTAYEGEGEITLDYDGNAALKGWNLVGNPFGETAYVNRSFYIMNEDGSEIIANEEGNSVEAMEGIFVVAEATGETVTFSTEEPSGKGQGLIVNLTQNRGAAIDRTIVHFGESGQLPKFMLNQNNTKIYIPQNGKDFAIVAAEAQGELPLNFKTEKSGSYTLNFCTEGLCLSYLHLIDNMTGDNVDLLATPSYTFEAKTTDYASRFKIVFATESDDEDIFAYNSNGVWIINNDGNATLQVIDVLGHMLSSETISGNTEKRISAAPGVYMLRLINGDNVKVQKIIIK